MKYDFTSIMDRRGMDATAVDGLGSRPGFAPERPKEGFDAIPMWVADMNFPACTMPETVAERLKHPAYGYFPPRAEYFQEIIEWHEKRNGVTGLRPEHIGYENGVLGGVVTALNVFCSRGDNVLLHSPTYIGFTNRLNNTGYHIIHSPLVKDEKGIWRMDFEDMEKKIVDNKIHAAVFCSPHNPCGRVWEQWEIEKAMEIYKKHDVYVVSDEIWSDIIRPGYKHIPTQSVSEDARMRTAAIYAPSKTFNLAGLIHSHVIIYDEKLMETYDAYIKSIGSPEVNLMGVTGMEAAYRGGEEWFENVKGLIRHNYEYMKGQFAKALPKIVVTPLEGTYLSWIDLRGYMPGDKVADFIQNKCRLACDVGEWFSFTGHGFVRINLATDTKNIKTAVERIIR